VQLGMRGASIVARATMSYGFCSEVENDVDPQNWQIYAQSVSQRLLRCTVDSQPTDKAEGVGKNFVRGGQDKTPTQKTRNSCERTEVKVDPTVTVTKGNEQYFAPSSQVNTLPIAKSQTLSKQNKGMHKCSGVYSERAGSAPPGFDIGRRMSRCPGMQKFHPRPTKSLQRHSNF
jgi:hypothetical protein